MEQDQQTTVHECSNGSILSGDIGTVPFVASGAVGQKCDDGKNTVLDSQGYVLRENPKKSWKFSGSSHNVNDASLVQGKKVKCTICGKEFASPTSLNGHLRHHTGKEKKRFRCDLCGNRFKSIRGLNGHMRTHSRKHLVFADSGIGLRHSNPVAAALSDAKTMNLVRRKRSKRTRYKFTSSSDLSTLNESLSGFEFDQVEEEVAESLLMLSSGVGTMGWSSFSSNPLGGTSVSREDGPLPSGGDVVPDDVEAVKVENMREERLDSCAGGSKRLVVEHVHVSCDKREVVSLEVQGDSVSEFSSGVSEKGIAFRSEANKAAVVDAVHLGHMNSISGSEVKKDNSSPNSRAKIGQFEDRKFKCKICDRSFATYQSLGGHQTSHRLAKCSISMKTEACKYSIQPNIVLEVEAGNSNAKLECGEDSAEQVTDEAMEVDCRWQMPKEYKCCICRKIFASGQALGGHKRAHWGKASEMEHGVCDISEVLDLDIPCLVNSEDNHDLQLEPLWAGSSLAASMKGPGPVGIITS